MSAQSLPKLESRVVISADGTRLHADAIGSRSPSSPVIVMIHGFGMVKAAFDSMFNDPQWISNAFLVRFNLWLSVIYTKNLLPVRYVTMPVGMEKAGSPHMTMPGSLGECPKILRLYATGLGLRKLL